MHSVMGSATIGREAKRQQTLHRISRCAQRLAAEQGLDGFTMEDLAQAAAVSRRTLFNYYPSKMDAVLGPAPDLRSEAAEDFIERRPHGDLFSDLGALAVALMSEHEFDRESVRLSHQLFTTEARVLAAAMLRFEQITDGFVELALRREGVEFGVDRARLLLKVLATVFEFSMSVFVENDDDRDLLQIFDEQLRIARGLLA